MPQTAPGNLTVSGSSSNPTLVPNANIVFGGTGANRTRDADAGGGTDGNDHDRGDGERRLSGERHQSSIDRQWQWQWRHDRHHPGQLLCTADAAGDRHGELFRCPEGRRPQRSHRRLERLHGAASPLSPILLATPIAWPWARRCSPVRASQAIYFAPNIAAAAANSNVVTVRFSTAAVYPDIRVLEYSGLDPVSPLHAVTASSGSSGTSSSGTLTVSVPNVLLVAGNIVATGTVGPGTGFTNRMITSPDGDIAEDRVVSTAGSYSATAPLSPSGYWVMQMAAFKAGALPPDTTPPTVAITAPVANANVTGYALP